MDLINGKYLDHEICAFSNDWLIVYDGRYNYYLFNCCNGSVIAQFKHKRMPYNRAFSDFREGGQGGFKSTEYYATFDGAVKNMCKCVANDGFLTKSRLIK